MAHSSPRWLAPLALVAACLALVVVLATSGSSDTASAPEQIPSAPARTAHTATGTTTTTSATTSQPASRAATYTVQSGDFLSTVAEKTGVSVDRLRQLNPGLNANAMHVGQKIRLK